MPGAQISFWWANNFVFLKVWQWDLHFWRETNSHSGHYWSLLLSWKVLFTAKVGLCPYMERMMETVTNISNAKPAATFWTFLSKTINRQLCCFCGDGIHCLVKKTSREYENKKPSFLKTFLHQAQSVTPKLVPKNQKSFHLWNKTPLVDTSKQKGISILIFIQFRSTVEQQDIFILQRR